MMLGVWYAGLRDPYENIAPAPDGEGAMEPISSQTLPVGRIREAADVFVQVGPADALPGGAGVADGEPPVEDGPRDDLERNTGDGSRLRESECQTMIDRDFNHA